MKSGERGMESSYSRANLYIWQLQDWPNFRFDAAAVALPLAAVHRAQGKLAGRMEALGLPQRKLAAMQMLTSDVLTTSEIEGEQLNLDTVRSSFARRLNMDIGALAPADRYVDGVVDMVLDATQGYAQSLTSSRLLAWHAGLFPSTGLSSNVSARFQLSAVQAGSWRNDAQGAMQVVSGGAGRQTVHFEAPPAQRLESEISTFLDWFNNANDGLALDPVLKAGLAHLWLVTLHPFDDGNGRIARAVGDMALAKAEQSTQRFYSLSAQIQRERQAYYTLLETTQKGDLDVTAWLNWFLACLLRAITAADVTLSAVLFKADFWQRWAGTPLNARQVKLINRLLDGFEGKLTSSKWASIAKCSPDTALRDIQDLLVRGVLQKSESGGRSTSYAINISVSAS
jgi:Fic family protein